MVYRRFGATALKLREAAVSRSGMAGQRRNGRDPRNRASSASSRFGLPSCELIRDVGIPAAIDWRAVC